MGEFPKGRAYYNHAVSVFGVHAVRRCMAWQALMRCFLPVDFRFLAFWAP